MGGLLWYLLSPVTAGQLKLKWSCQCVSEFLTQQVLWLGGESRPPQAGVFHAALCRARVGWGSWIQTRCQLGGSGALGAAGALQSHLELKWSVPGALYLYCLSTKLGAVVSTNLVLARAVS